AEDGIRDFHVTGVQTCALPILVQHSTTAWWLGRVSGHAGSASGSKTTSVPIIVACLAAVAVKAGGITLPAPVLDAANLLGSLAEIGRASCRARDEIAAGETSLQ